MDRLPSDSNALHTVGGPGTELGRLIPDWLAKQSGGCKCSDHAAQMDAWGIDGCIENREIIIKWLLAEKSLLPFALQIIPAAALRAGAGVMLDCAIHNAKLLDPE